MKIAVKIAFMAAAMVPAAASAQEAGRMLSLDEAVAVTLTENPALKAAAYEERAAQQQRRAAIEERCAQLARGVNAFGVIDLFTHEVFLPPTELAAQKKRHRRQQNGNALEIWEQ